MYLLMCRVVIETTGIADPAPVIQTLFMDDECRKHMRLDACITVVDSKHIDQHFGILMCNIHLLYIYDYITADCSCYSCGF